MSRNIAITYYTFQDIEEISKAKDMERILQIASDVFGRMPKPVCLVVGPTTTGTRSIEENKKRRRKTIAWLRKQGVSAPNYTPFERKVLQILSKEFGEKEARSHLWDRFFIPLIENGTVGKVRILPGDVSSNVNQTKKFASEIGIDLKLMPGPEELPE
jgi:hypothetical protein